MSERISIEDVARVADGRIIRPGWEVALAADLLDAREALAELRAKNERLRAAASAILETTNAHSQLVECGCCLCLQHGPELERALLKDGP